MMTWMVIIALGATCTGLAALVVWQRGVHARVVQRFAGIDDVAHEIAQRRAALELELSKQRGELVSVSGRTAELQRSHARLIAAHAQLRAELTVLEQRSDAVAVGLEPPSFPPGTPEDYQRWLREARAKQRALVHGNEAVRYGDRWTFGGSLSEGARQQRQYARLLLRAFNGECEGAIARLGASGHARMVERLTQAFAAINRLGAALEIQLTEAYLDAKLEELQLEHDRAQLPAVEPTRAVTLRVVEGPDQPPLDDHRLARGSIPIQLVPHAPRLVTVGPSPSPSVEAVGPVEPTVGPEAVAPTVDDSAS